MSGGKRELIRQATEALQLKEIILFQSRLVRPEPFPAETDASAEQQARYSVRLERLDPLDQDDGASSLIQCFVHLGTRLISSHDESEKDDTHVYVEIEAEFRVTYELTVDELAEDAMKAFAQFNVVHNVWPFWRQHVFDLVQRGGLPKMEVPLFAGVKL